MHVKLELEKDVLRIHVHLNVTKDNYLHEYVHHVLSLS